MSGTEPGVLKIFRFFSAGVSGAFFLLMVLPGPIGASDPINRRAALAFSITYAVIFLYLIIPNLEKKLRHLYFPPVLIAASIIPIAIINAEYQSLQEAGLAINYAKDTLTISILLLFPLIATAWQYSFPIVFLFFVVLGFLDPLLIIVVTESLADEAYAAFNSSLIRILALGAVGFMITELRSIQRSERRALQEANRKLEEFARASEQLAVSRERNRLARELHDTLAHTLSGVAIQLEAVDTLVQEDQDNLRAMIQRARVSVRDGLGETRRALKALRASPLDDLGLALSLRRLADDAAGRDAVAIDLHLSENLPDWSDTLEECVYRIAQEALENVVRHAKASRAALSLEGDAHWLELKIIDDGRGFDAVANMDEARFGLKGMQERSETARGHLNVTSHFGKGTEVCFTWKDE